MAKVYILNKGVVTVHEYEWYERHGIAFQILKVDKKAKLYWFNTAFTGKKFWSTCKLGSIKRHPRVPVIKETQYDDLPPQIKTILLLTPE